MKSYYNFIDFRAINKNGYFFAIKQSDDKVWSIWKFEF